MLLKGIAGPRRLSTALIAMTWNTARNAHEGDVVFALPVIEDDEIGSSDGGDGPVG
jgi:hypothetical protein